MRQIGIASDDFSIREGESVAEFVMEGVVFKIALIETDAPEFIPERTQDRSRVVVKKKAFSLNFRDRGLLFNAHSILNAKDSNKHFFAFGSDFVGEVLSVGSDVIGLAPGDRVIPDSSYPALPGSSIFPGVPTNSGSAEIEVLHYKKLKLIPQEISDEIAAGFTIGAQTCASMVRRLDVKPGERVLITAGRSNTSLFALATLKGLPAVKCVLTSSEDHVEKLKNLGADYVFVIGRETKSLLASDDVVSYIRQHGNFDCIIDPMGDLYLPRVLDLFNMGGRYITCGILDQSSQYTNAKFDLPITPLNVLLMKSIVLNATIIGNCLGSSEDLANAITACAEGRLKIPIDSTYSDTDIFEFMDRTFNATDRFGKVIYCYS